MDETLARTADSFRNRLEQLDRDLRELDAEAKRLGSLLGDTPATQETPDLRAARAPLKKTQARILELEQQRHRLREQYAAFRLKNALGSDPDYIPDALLEKILMQLASAGDSWVEPIPPTNPIDRAWLKILLLNPVQLAHVARTRSLHHDAASMLNPNSEAKLKLREWSSLLATEPYVNSKLCRAVDLEASFKAALEKLRSSLDNLRNNYEIAQKRVDLLRITRRGGACWVEACDLWDNIEKRFPKEARTIFRRFYELQSILAELAELRAEINAHLRAFMKRAVALLVALLAEQTKDVRRAYLGDESPNKKLCQYLAAEADRTDFLNPDPPGLAFPRLALPDEFAEINALASYRAARDSFERTRLQNSPTTHHT